MGSTLKAHCDRRGRIYLTGALRAKYGREFIVVEAPSGIVLLPVPEDIQAEFASLGTPLRSLSPKEVKGRIARRGRSEAGSGLR